MWNFDLRLSKIFVLRFGDFDDENIQRSVFILQTRWIKERSLLFYISFIIMLLSFRISRSTTAHTKKKIFITPTDNIYSKKFHKSV